MEQAATERKNERAPDAPEEVSMSEARDRLTELVSRVAYGGEVIVITRSGKPIAQLTAVRAVA